MKAVFETIQLQTQHHKAYDITAQVKEIVERSGVKDGICTVFCPETTAGICIPVSYTHLQPQRLFTHLGDQPVGMSCDVVQRRYRGVEPGDVYKRQLPDGPFCPL